MVRAKHWWWMGAHGIEISWWVARQGLRVRDNTEEHMSNGNFT